MADIIKVTRIIIGTFNLLPASTFCMKNITGYWTKYTSYEHFAKILTMLSSFPTYSFFLLGTTEYLINLTLIIVAIII